MFSSRSFVFAKHSILSKRAFSTKAQKGIYIWGRGDKGQLGLGEGVISQPTPVRLPFKGAIKSISTGPNHVVLLTKKGEIYNFGENTHGQLGQGHTEDLWTPSILPTPGKSENVIKRIACGGHHTLIAVESKDGPQLFAFGRNKEGQLGLGTEEDHVTVPREVTTFRGQSIVAMSCGEDFSVVVTADDVFTFGRGDAGQHGVDMWGATPGNCREPHKLIGLTDRINRLSCGWGHVVAVAKRRVWSWGANAHGQCGSTDSPVPLSPLLMMAFPHEQPRVIQVACGSTHSMVLSADNRVYIGGSAADGKLGMPTQGDLMLPERLTIFDDKPVETIACGVDHSSVLAKDGVLWMWGFGQHGALGFPKMETVNSPTPLSPPEGLKFTTIGCGMDISVAMAE